MVVAKFSPHRVAAILFVLTVLLLASPRKTFANSPQANRSPNIIFIMADDLGYGELGCYGQKKINTPGATAGLSSSA